MSILLEKVRISGRTRSTGDILTLIWLVLAGPKLGIPERTWHNYTI